MSQESHQNRGQKGDKGQPTTATSPTPTVSTGQNDDPRNDRWSIYTAIGASIGSNFGASSPTAAPGEQPTEQRPGAFASLENKLKRTTTSTSLGGTKTPSVREAIAAETLEEDERKKTGELSQVKPSGGNVSSGKKPLPPLGKVEDDDGAADDEQSVHQTTDEERSEVSRSSRRSKPRYTSYAQGYADVMSDNDIDLDTLEEIDHVSIADDQFWSRHRIGVKNLVKTKLQLLAHTQTVLAFKYGTRKVLNTSVEYADTYIRILERLLIEAKTRTIAISQSRSASSARESPSPKSASKKPRIQVKEEPKGSPEVGSEPPLATPKTVMEPTQLVPSDLASVITAPGIAVPTEAPAVPPKLTRAEFRTAKRNLKMPIQEGETLDEYQDRLNQANRFICLWYGYGDEKDLINPRNELTETEEEYKERLKVYATILNAYHLLAMGSIDASTRESARTTSNGVHDDPISVHFAHQDDATTTNPQVVSINVKATLKDRAILQNIRNKELRETGDSRYADQGVRFEGPRNEPIDIALMEYASRNTPGRNQGSSASRPRAAAGAPDYPGSSDDDDDDEPRRPGRGPLPSIPGGNGGNGGGRRPPSEPYRGGTPGPPRPPRGLSTPRDSIARSTTPGLAEVSENYRDMMMNRLIELIRQHLSARIKLPEGTKLRRMDGKSVGLYMGGKTFSELEEWLTNLVLYLQASQYGGPERDGECVLAVAEFLGPNPKRWYNRKVHSVRRTQLTWTFEEVIVAMYTRYVHPSSMQDARVAFEATRYNPAEGVQAFYETLQDHAENMRTYPDEYSMMDAFLKGIPSEMTQEMIMNGYNPEMHTVDDFLTEAIAIETAKKTAANYRSRSRTTAATPAAAQPRKDYPPRRDDKRGDKRVLRLPVIGKTYVPRTQAYNADGTRRIFIQTKDMKNPQPLDRRPARQYAERAPRRSDPKPARKGNCFKCGKPGHFSNECPDGDKPKDYIRAARTAADPDADDEKSDKDDGKEEGKDPGSDNAADSDVSAETVTSMDIHGYAFLEEAGSEGDNMFAIREHETEVEEVLIEYETIDSEDDSHDDSPIPTMSDHVRTIREEDANEAVSTTGKPLDRRVVYRKVHVRVSLEARDRPEYPPEKKECLASFIKVGGVEAWALYDSGSTTCGMTPAFTDVAKLKVFPLKKPIVLQLGTIGSRSTVNHGIEPVMEMPGFKGTTYMDVANFDRYDMILGTPFMRENGVVLDFNTNTVIVNGVRSPATRVALADTDGRARRYRTVEKVKANDPK